MKGLGWGALLIMLSLGTVLFVRWSAQVDAPALATRLPTDVPTTPPTSQPTHTPLAVAVVRVDIHAEVSASGEGKASALAMGAQGKARSEITSSGHAQGLAQANAPECELCTGGEADQATSLVKENGSAPVWLTVTTDAVNLRAGPGPGYAVLGMAMRGETYAVIGRNADTTWWQVMTPSGERWISDAFAQVTDAGALVKDNGTPAQPVTTPWPTDSLRPANTATLVVTPTPSYAFELVQSERHSEAHTVNLYAWVHDRAANAVTGYRLLVMREGQQVAGERPLTGAQLGTTRPSCPGCRENQPYNLKMAWDNRAVFADGLYDGMWTVQLVDAAGLAVGEPAVYTIGANDEQMELFVEYRSRE